MKIRGIFYLFVVCTALLICLGACNRRYAHVKKVRADKKTSMMARHAARKKQPVALPFKMPVQVVAPSTDINHTPYISPAKKHDTATYYTPALFNAPFASVPHDTTDSTVSSPPLNTVKLNKGNFREVLLTALIVGLISLLISFASAAVVIILLSSIYTGGHGLIVLRGFLAIYVILGAILFVPIVQLLKQLFQKLHKMEFTYAGTSYTLGDVKHMPKAVRLKRTWHNLVVSFLLLIPASLLFFLPPIAFTFYAVFTWYSLKLLFILLFVHDK